MAVDLELFAGVVSEPEGQVPEAREAVAESAGPQRAAWMQRRHDAKHLSGGGARLSALPTSHRHQQIPPGEHKTVVSPYSRQHESRKKNVGGCKSVVLIRRRHPTLNYGNGASSV
jgi:hypothetical protein